MSKPDIRFNSGTSVNFPGKCAIGEFTLHGDPEIKIEKPYTLLRFPGGQIEISRTTDDRYWVHIAVNAPDDVIGTDNRIGVIDDARIDAADRYVDPQIAQEIVKADVRHVAILIRPEEQSA